MNSENIRIAFKAIRSQVLRTILTVLIIAFGIMALVGILTTIDALKAKINNDFSRMGVNTISLREIRNDGERRAGKSSKTYPKIDYREAVRFSEDFDYPAQVSLSAFASFVATVKYNTIKTNPNVRVIGGDGKYLSVSGFDLEAGRNFSRSELIKGSQSTILGADILKKLELEPDQALNKFVTIGAKRYKVIGILKSKGSSMGMSNDNQVIVPIKHVKLALASPSTRYTVSVTTDTPDELAAATDAAIGTMRVIRGDRIGEPMSFEVRSSDSTANNIIETLSFITIAATFIGVITLIGAAIGLMNIMLVSVTERTKEIGLRKSIGATKSNIRWQFLVEAITIGQIGGLVGTLFGIAAGNAIAVLVGADFIIPWNWIGMAVLICLLVSVVSGFYPAAKAANLDPIDALRYE